MPGLDIEILRKLRAEGKAPSQIVRKIRGPGQHPKADLLLTLPERLALEKWEEELQRKREERREREEAQARKRALEPPAPVPPPRKSLGRAGIPPKLVCEMLDCTRTELDR
jgi:hypothetical protein